MGRSRHLMPSRARAVVVTMPAEIDITNAGRIGGQLSAAITGGAGIVVADMTGTTFCNSSGISVLVMAHRQAAANGAELRLVVLCAAVLRALKLVRMDCLLPIYPSLDAALTPEAAPEPELEAAPEPELEAAPEPELEAAPEPRVTGVCPGRRGYGPQPFPAEVVAFPDRRGPVHP